MKKILMRPAAALFPLALILGGAESIPLLPIYFALQIFSLCAVDSFRNAAAREPGLRKADRRFWGAVLPLLVSLALMILLPGFFMGLRDHIIPVAAVWLVIIEQLFEERLFTLNRRTDGNILSLIAAALLGVGLILDGSNGVTAPVDYFYTLLASGAAALIGIITSLMIAPPRGFSLLPRNLGFAPKSMVQTLLYPAACLAFFYFYREIPAGHTAFLCGLILWRLSRTICRRASDESRSLNLLLIFVNAALIAAMFFLPGLEVYTACCALALICAAIVYLAPSIRLYVGMALLAAALFCLSEPFPYWEAALFACCAASVLINLKHAFLRRK